MCFCAAAVVLFYGAGLLRGSVWPAVLGHDETMLLLVLAGACFVNFGRNRTLHCTITGPIVLLGRSRRRQERSPAGARSSGACP